MSSMRVVQLPATPTGAGLPGHWTLARDRAITLATRQRGCLRVANGALWATLDGPHVQGAANEWGDRFLRSGACIQLEPGQHVVLEAYPEAANEASCFSWEPDVDAAAPAEFWLGRIGRRVRAWGRSAGAALGQWAEPGPGWPRHAEDFYAAQRDRVWRTLYHLGINQP